MKEDMKISGSIEMNEVEMRYSKKLRPAIENMSLKVQKGEKIAIVGRTGSGKSSLFQML